MKPGFTTVPSTTEEDSRTCLYQLLLVFNFISWHLALKLQSCVGVKPLTGLGSCHESSGNGSIHLSSYLVTMHPCDSHRGKGWVWCGSAQYICLASPHEWPPIYTTSAFHLRSPKPRPSGQSSCLFILR